MSNLKQIISDLIKVKPKDINGTSNLAYTYWCNRLFAIIRGQVLIEGCPDGWDLDYMYEALFRHGTMCITDTTLGVIPLRCGVQGINVFDHPTHCIVANPILGSFTREIDLDCALIKIQDNFMGIMDIINRFAVLLSTCDGSISQNLLNTRTSRIFRASSKAAAASYRKMVDDVMEGNPAVFINDSLQDRGDMYIDNLKQQYIAQDIHTLQYLILGDFYTLWGIDTANTDKKERLITAEADVKSTQSKASVGAVLQNIREGFAVANRLYDLNLTVKLANETATENQEEMMFHVKHF